MPIMTTRPVGRVMANAVARLSAEPTQSIVTAAPPVSRDVEAPCVPFVLRVPFVPRVPRTCVPVRRRTARASSPGSQTTVAPSARARSRWCGCLAPITVLHSGAKLASAARVSSPRVPAPMIATVSPGRTRARIAPWTAHAVGSTSTAAWSVMSSGTACSWLGCATIEVDQPPPVSQQ